MTSPAHSWRQNALDAGCAAFASVVVFLVPLNDILFTNVRDLLYDRSLVRGFALAGVALWMIGFWVVGRFNARFPARLWAAAPWAVLLLDVIGANLEKRSVPIPSAAFADALVFVLVLTIAVFVPWSALRATAAAAAIALLLQGVVTHASFVRGLSPNLIAGSMAAPPAPPRFPVADLPGNVYHILLDNYLSESFKHLTADDAATRYPGFTFYSRFNTNFPRTSSSEPALIHGRFPRPGLSIEEWPQIALREGFWRDLAVANVALWLYPYGRWLCPDYATKCVASMDLEREAHAHVTRNATIDLWGLRLFPASLRRALGATPAPSAGHGASHGIGFSATGMAQSLLNRKQPHSHTHAPNVNSLPAHYFNLRQFEALLADEPLRPPRGQYVYYHALIPHPPYIMNERCEYVAVPTVEASAYWAHARCANLMIERLVRELSRLGRLDSSLIIVHADHGDMEFLLNVKLPGRSIDFALDPGARRYQAPDTTYQDWALFDPLNSGDSARWRSIAVEIFSSGLLLVKFPHARTYSEDASPAQLLDIAPAVLAHFGVSSRSYPGSPISAVQPEREVVFYAHSRGFDGKLSKYRLTRGGWQFVEDVPVAP